jgi:hypothetical protein
MKYTEEFIRKLIAEWLKKNYDFDLDTISPNNKDDPQAFAQSCRYSLIENYTPDCPGWCGSVLTVVFGYSSAILNFRIIQGLQLAQDEAYLERIDSEM